MSLEKISEALKDVELEGKEDLLKKLTDTYDLASAADKIKQANADLLKDRDSSKEVKRQLREQIEALQQKIEQSGNKKEDKSSKSNQDIERLTSDLEKLKNEIATAKTEAEKAKQDAREKTLKSNFVDLLTQSQAQKPGDAFILMKAHGFITKDGKGADVFARKNHLGNFETATKEEAVSNWLELNPEHIKSSGNAGSGGSHRQGNVTRDPARDKHGFLKDPLKHL